MKNNLLSVDEMYNHLNKKLKRTTHFYITLIILIYLFSASIIILNIFAIRKNPGSAEVKWLFVAVAISTAVSSFFSSTISLFVFKKKNKKISEKIKMIQIEKNHFKNKAGDYSQKNAEALLVDKVTRILNR